MEKQEIIESIISILEEINLIDSDTTIDENTSLYNEYGINSIEIIDLIVHIEEKYDFEFNNSNLSLGDFETISKIADIIHKQLFEGEE